MLDNESWPGMAEADRDRLQELQLISQQRRSPEDIARLEEEKRRLEDEIQRARATSAHGATERFGNLNCFLLYCEIHLGSLQKEEWGIPLCLRKK